MPIVREYLPSFEAVGDIAAATGRGLFEQSQDQFQAQQDRFAAGLAEQQRQFNVRNALQAQQAAQRAALQQQALQADLAQQAMQNQAREQAAALEFARAQELQAQRDQGIMDRMKKRAVVDQVLAEQKFEREQEVLGDERKAKRLAAETFINAANDEINETLDVLRRELPDHPMVKQLEQTASALQKQNKSQRALGADVMQKPMASFLEDFRDKSTQLLEQAESQNKSFAQQVEDSHIPVPKGETWIIPDGMGRPVTGGDPPKAPEEIQLEREKELQGMAAKWVEKQIEGLEGIPSPDKVASYLRSIQQGVANALNPEWQPQEEEVAPPQQTPAPEIPFDPQAATTAPIGSIMVRPDGRRFQKTGPNQFTEL